ncbi:uncharacterized protein [Antedon mediterranea]|uniref:uncharacterized protein n=1 Tax=Antedon mediterranea TaxID=105859 RepID=UPI003AF7679B
MAENFQARVMLWCIPRSISTAFTKCMSHLDDVQIISEPYASVYFCGPDRQLFAKDEINKDNDSFHELANAVEMDYQAGWKSDTATYKFIKEDVLEREYPDKKVVFARDMSFGITGKIDMLPKGYRHAFLIRNPTKLFPSWKKMLKKFPNKSGKEVNFDTSGWLPAKYGFGESLELYEHLVSSGIETNPVIIDADDLLANPKSILKQLCERTGIEYTDKLLSWDGNDGVVHTWKSSTMLIKGNKACDYYQNAFSSTSFATPKPEPNRAELDDDVNACIDAAQPYYDKMYALRVKPE